MDKLYARLLGALLCGGVVLPLCWAQTQSVLTGQITDDSGAVVVGAQLAARHAATGVVTETVSNEAGRYLFPFLPPGQYELTCQVQGFKKVARGGIVLETGATRIVDLRLEVGALTETVQVTAAAPLLESQTSTVGQFVERTTVFNMPLESRRTAGLVRLLGTVVFRQENPGEQIPIFSMAGGRSQNQMWHLDGGVVQNMALGVAQLQLNPPSESLQEFKGELNNYSAEFGRTGNGLILMTTRSGTNQFHGAAYEFLRHQAVDTRTFFAQSVAPLRYNIFGASFSGPIRKDKTFFFANYEGARRRDGLTSSGNIVPHPAEVRGDFSARRDVQILDPANNQPFPGNLIPASRIDPLARQFAAFYPAPNTPNNDVTRAPSANYNVNLSDKLTQDFGTLRVDHVAGNNDRFYGRYSSAHAPLEVDAIFPNKFADSRAGIRENKINNVLGSWIHNFSPTVINETRYNWASRLHINRAAGIGSKKNGEIGLAGVNPDAFARINIAGLTPLGAGTHERIQAPILTHQVIENVTVVRGAHTLKAGFEWRYSFNKDDFNQQTGGNFTFNDRATRSGLATLLLGWTSAASLVDTDLLEVRSDYYGAFLQDDWKLTNNFTLNLGLRWEMDTPRWERAGNRQSGFDPFAINPVSGTPGTVVFSGRGGQSKYAHQFDKNNFGPRFGFAFKPRQRLVVRGGYGLNYNGAYAGAVPFVLTHGFSLNTSFSSPDGGFTPAFAFRSGLPAGVREELGPGFGAVPLGRAPRISPDFFARDHVNGYAQQYNLTVQKELLGNLLLETAYLANLGHKLGGQNLDINMIPLVNGRGPERQNQALRPFPQFNNVTWLSPAWGNSSYHALNVKLEKRYSNGLNFLMNYTWSKFLDDVEANGELAGGEGSGYTHIELRRLDKSYSGNDVRHRYIASGVYELPLGKGKRLNADHAFTHAVIGGWSLGVIAEFRSGAPYGAIEQTNTTNAFSNSQRPNLTCDPALGAGRTRGQLVAQFFQTACFASPGTGVFGNAPRTFSAGPGFIGIDLSVSKRWTVTERFGLQFRTEFFNLPNRPNFAAPAAVHGRGDFGSLTSTIGTGRQIQFNLRLEF